MASNDVKELIAHLRKQGFTVALARSGHYQVTSKDGAHVQIPATPSDRRSLLNVRSRLKHKLGYDPRA